MPAPQRLPDAGKLLSLSPATWRAFARNLEAVGFAADALAPFARIASRAYSPLRAPIVKWHLQQASGPAALAMRLLWFWDPITRDDARAVVGGQAMFGDLLRAGFLEETPDGRIVSAYLTHVVNGVYIVSDDLRAGGDAVMGPGPTTIDLLRAACPSTRIDRALDLGCGAGTAALLFAPHAERVVATDINPRALDIVQVNAWMNGIENIDLRTGDLFAPVAGEVFDLVVSQPPFIAHHDADQNATFLFGGPRGDELPLRVLRELPPYLARGGLAILLIQWPLAEGDAELEARVRSAVGTSPEYNVMVLPTTELDIDEHCVSYAMLEEPGLGDAYERAVLKRRGHFARMKIRGMRHTFNVVGRATDGDRGGWTSTVMASAASRDVDVRRAQIDALVAARSLLARGRRALLSARLRVPDETRFVQAKEGGDVQVTPGEGALGDPLILNALAASLVAAVHEADNVKRGIEQLARTTNVAVESMAEKALASVENALLFGVLEVA